MKPPRQGVLQPPLVPRAELIIGGVCCGTWEGFWLEPLDCCWQETAESSLRVARPPRLLCVKGGSDTSQKHSTDLSAWFLINLHYKPWSCIGTLSAGKPVSGNEMVEDLAAQWQRSAVCFVHSSSSEFGISFGGYFVSRIDGSVLMVSTVSRLIPSRAVALSLRFWLPNTFGLG